MHPYEFFSPFLGSLGLGFSITTRDNALGDNTPIYIKNILPKGNFRLVQLKKNTFTNVHSAY